MKTTITTFDDMLASGFLAGPADARGRTTATCAHPDAPWITLVNVPVRARRRAGSPALVIPQRAWLNRLAMAAMALQPAPLEPRHLRFAMEHGGLRASDFPAASRVTRRRLTRWASETHPSRPTAAYDVAIRHQLGEAFLDAVPVNRDRYTIWPEICAAAAPGTLAPPLALTFEWTPDVGSDDPEAGFWREVPDDSWLAIDGEPARPGEWVPGRPADPADVVVFDLFIRFLYVDIRRRTLTQATLPRRMDGWWQHAPGGLGSGRTFEECFEPPVQLVNAAAILVATRLRRVTRSREQAAWLLDRMEEVICSPELPATDPRVVVRHCERPGEGLQIVVNRRRVIAAVPQDPGVIQLLLLEPPDRSRVPEAVVVHEHATGAVTVELPIDAAMTRWASIAPLWWLAIDDESWTCQRSGSGDHHSLATVAAIGSPRTRERILACAWPARRPD